MTRLNELVIGLFVVLGIAHAAPSDARVTSIVIDSRATAYGGVGIDNAGPYETLNGRVFGEIRPNDPHNATIQDIHVAPKDANGYVHYIATFQVTKPVNMSLSNGLMIYEVSNRGGNAIPTTASAVVTGATYVQSGWQGDLLSNCPTAYPCVC